MPICRAPSALRSAPLDHFFPGTSWQFYIVAYFHTSYSVQGMSLSGCCIKGPRHAIVCVCRHMADRGRSKAGYGAKQGKVSGKQCQAEKALPYLTYPIVANMPACCCISRLNLFQKEQNCHRQPHAPMFERRGASWERTLKAPLKRVQSSLHRSTSSSQRTNVGPRAPETKPIKNKTKEKPARVASSKLQVKLRSRWSFRSSVFGR